MKVLLAAAAERELIEAARHYAQEGGVKLGESFLEEFERCSALLSDHPALGAPFRAGVRRLPMRRFPYSLFYDQPGATTLRVLAVAHQRRRPAYWGGRR